MKKEEKAKVTAAKEELRSEIRLLMDQIRAVQTVPVRILDKADREATAAYKDTLEAAKSKMGCSYVHGTLNDLSARVHKLKTWLHAIQ